MNNFNPPCAATFWRLHARRPTFSTIMLWGPIPCCWLNQLGQCLPLTCSPIFGLDLETGRMEVENSSDGPDQNIGNIPYTPLSKKCSRSPRRSEGAISPPPPPIPPPLSHTRERKGRMIAPRFFRASEHFLDRGEGYFPSSFDPVPCRRLPTSCAPSRYQGNLWGGTLTATPWPSLIKPHNSARSPKIW